MEQLNSELPNAIAWKHSAEHHHAQSLRTAADRDEWRELCMRLARHIRNTETIPPVMWGIKGIDLLVEVREKDPITYEKLVK